MPNYSEIMNFCIAQLASILEIDAGSIPTSATFASLGLDSAMAVHLVLAVEEWLGVELYPAVTADYPSLEAFSAYLSSQ